MKRNECTVNSLKELGYIAKRRFVNNWIFGSDTTEPCNEKQSAELFNIVVNIVRNGGCVDIRRNNFTYEVNVFVEGCKHEFGGSEIEYFLSRNMTEVERLEADLYTGRNK